MRLVCISGQRGPESSPWAAALGGDSRAGVIPLKRRYSSQPPGSFFSLDRRQILLYSVIVTYTAVPVFNPNQRTILSWEICAPRHPARRSGHLYGSGARLEKGLRQYVVAMLCAEEDPTGCHRRLLVGRVLAERGVAVRHIRGDGQLQAEDELSAAEPDSNQLSLFEEIEAPAWKSIPSVSLKRRQSTSSAF